MRRGIGVAAVVAAAGVGLAVADDPKPAAKAAARERVLPGLRKDGFVQLPNQWKLNPVGKQIEVGDLPVNIQFHPSGQFAAVFHCGFKDHEVAILDTNPKGQKVLSRATIDQGFYGLAFSPDGKQLYASGGEFDIVHVWDFDKGYLHNRRTLDVSTSAKRTVTAGLAFGPGGRDLYACGLWANAVVRVPLDNPDNKVVIPLTPPAPKPAPKDQGAPPSPPDGRKENAPPKDAVAINDDDPGLRAAADNGYPYAVLVEPTGKRAFVTLWAKAAVAVVDLESNKVVAGWPTAEHPTELVLSPDGKALYVACANSTKVSVLDPANGDVLQTVVAALYPLAPAGNTPNSLALTPDGQMLFVANADANNLAVFNVADRKQAKPLGFIPTGWYPTSVRFNPLDKSLYIANGKGLSSRPNPAGPNPVLPGKNLTREYIGSMFQGTVGVLPVPTPGQMARYSKQAYECSPLQKGDAVRTAGRSADNPIPAKIGDPSPIKYVIYVIKENRTYDQVFGDMKEGNGEPDLCIFPEAVTPNHHKLAREFVLLDNTYVDGEVSADGHEWSMGAYATDFVEKLWPLSYRGSKRETFGYPGEATYDPLARPAGGYLWDRAIEAKVSVRSYGEWVTNFPRNKDGSYPDVKPSVPALVGRIDPKFRGYDLEYPDVKRTERFLSELKRFEGEGDMPRLQIVKLPNDHTSGTRVGKPTPRAQVADNDLALGLLVEGVSKSKFWKETAIFVIEDDAQNGPDHVDAHRVVALVVSPYTKRGFVDSDLYSTTSLLRTMELILGLRPMSQFDAAARPMFNSFQAKPDTTPYTHAVPQVDLNELNKPGAFGAKLSESFDLTKEDQADDLLFNEVIWRSVKGPTSKMPAPVRAAFFVPVKASKKDDDD